MLFGLVHKQTNTKPLDKWFGFYKYVFVVLSLRQKIRSGGGGSWASKLTSKKNYRRLPNLLDLKLLAIKILVMKYYQICFKLIIKPHVYQNFSIN